MSDRHPVYYKSPLNRFVETASVLILALIVAALWHEIFPDISARYAVLAALVAGFLLIPQIGVLWCARSGAPLMSVEERTARYLSEIVPLGSANRGMTIPVYSRTARRATERRARGG